MIKDAVNDPAGNLSLNVSVGTQKSESHSESSTVLAQGSSVKAVGDVNITAKEKDINIKGSNVEGENISLKAKEDINITASDNTNKTEQNSKSSSASVGVGISLITGEVGSVNIGGSKGKGQVNTNGTAYNESTVTANKDLTFTSGEDTNIKGGMLSGEKVIGNVGGDLNIESKQDSNRYEENNSSSSIGIGIDITGKGTPNKTGIFGGVSKGNMDSSYDSVTDQSGIYAGKEGFDITVGDNTDLKGGIIDSKAEADKNKISTGTLTFEDIHNKAEYEADNKGFGIDTSKDAKKENAGITPNLGMSVADKSESDTKATIAEGEIEIRDKENQKQNVADLNRDTQNSLNKLAEIFDRNTVAEKQEFAGLLQEVAHSAIGDLTGKISAEEKAVLNVFVDGIISSLSNGDFLAGASGTALVESMQGALSKIKDPALRQIATGVLGAAISEALTGKGQAGASSAVSTEKYNHLPHEEQERLANEIFNAKDQNDIVNIIDAALEKSTELRESDPGKAEDIEQVVLDALSTLTKYDNAGVSFEPNGDLGMQQNLINAKEFFKEYNIVKYLPEIFGEAVKLTAIEITGPATLAGTVLTAGDFTYSIYNSYDKNGLNKDFIFDGSIESLKTGAFYIFDKSNKGIPAGIVIIGKSVATVYLNNNVKREPDTVVGD